MTTTRHTTTRTKAVLAFTVASALMLGACGQDSSGGGDVDADGLSRAKAAIADYSENPTSIEITTPLSRTPDADKTIIQIQTTSPSAVTLADAQTAAGEALGWKVVTVSSDGTPEGNQQALQQAIDLAPDGITYSGIPKSTLAAQLKQAAAKDIPVIESSSTDTAGGGLTMGVSTEMFTQWGELTAAYVTAKSEGKAKVLLVDLPAAPILTLYIDAFKKALKDYCAACSTSYLPQAFTDIGTKTPTAVVSELQKAPDTDWVVLSLGDLALGVADSMASAGLKADIAGLTGASNNFDALSKGSETMWTADSLPIVGWSVIDAFARQFNGDSLDPSSQAVRPTQLLTADNIDGAVLNEDKAYIGVTDYAAQFKKLWMVN